MSNLITNSQNKLYVVNNNALELKNYIQFEDQEVRRICAETWGDGFGITQEQAAAVTNSQFWTTFNSKTNITTFNEFKYFTSVTTTQGGAAASVSAFGGCSNLKEIFLPISLKTLGNYTFANCGNLSTITIPSTVTTNTGTFANCSSVQRINITNIANYLNCTWHASNGHPFAGRAAGGTLWLNGEQVTSVTIPSTITAIKQYMFYRIKGITSVILPNSITSIATYAFANCSLNSINIPSSVTSIGTYAFSGSSLQNIIVPSSVTSIGQYAFANTTALIDATFMSETLNFNFNMLGNGVNNISGIGTGTLHIKSNATMAGGTQVTYRFKKILIEKNFNQSGPFWSVSNANATIQQIRVGGNYTNSATSQTYGYVFYGHQNVDASKFAFMEIMGTVTTSYVLVGSLSRYIANGFIYHLGYDAYTNNAVPCSPSVLGLNYERVAKAYVGKGVSAEEDNNILSVYASDANWATYVNNGKVDTWYNYINSADANPDYIN